MKDNYFVAASLTAIALTCLTFLFDLLSPGITDYSRYWLNLLANLLIAGVMGYYVNIYSHRANKLWLFTFIIYYVIGNFNILVEALIFNVTDQSQTIHSMLIGIPFCAIGAYLIIFLFGRKKPRYSSMTTFMPRKTRHWIGKILVGNFLYFVFYIVAGILLQTFTPRFEEFYSDKIPSFLDIILTNMFFRGFVFVGIAILIDRTTQGTTLMKAILTGSIFSIVGGIAPLIPYNEFMPTFIRVAHGLEVGISNFLFGILALLIVRSRLQEDTHELVTSKKNDSEKITT